MKKFNSEEKVAIAYSAYLDRENGHDGEPLSLSAVEAIYTDYNPTPGQWFEYNEPKLVLPLAYNEHSSLVSSQSSYLVTDQVERVTFIVTPEVGGEWYEIIVDFPMDRQSMLESLEISDYRNFIDSIAGINFIFGYSMIEFIESLEDKPDFGHLLKLTFANDDLFATSDSGEKSSRIQFVVYEAA